MKVLYIKSDAVRKLAKNRKWRQVFSAYLNRNMLIGQNGFFEGALNSTFDVTERSWLSLKKIPKSSFRTYDVIVVNQKSVIAAQQMKELADYTASIPMIYFASGARAEKMPSNEVLDNYNLIFKREPYKDLDQYEHLSPANREKIRPTMLSCPLVNIKKGGEKSFALEAFRDLSRTDHKYDVSFSGKGTSRLRYDICNALSQMEQQNSYLSVFNPRKGAAPSYLSPNIKTAGLKRMDYAKLIQETKINLALRGIGQFTHRHLELWYLGAFMLSDPSIREIQLPHGNPSENIHYTVFENEKDLAEKIHYYLHNENERIKIAAAGQEFFKQIYDFKKHGRYIRECIESL